MFFFFSSRRRHTRCSRDWSSDVCSSDLARLGAARERAGRAAAEVEEARRQSAALAEEMGALEHDTATLTAQRTQWEDQLKERRLALVALESAAREAGVQVEAADARVAQTEEIGRAHV